MLIYSPMLPSPEPFLLFFYAEGCPSSASMVRVLRDVQKHFGDRLPCISLNINSVIAQRHECKATVAPTLVLMRGKDELWRNSGLIHLSEVVSSVEGLI